MNLYQDYLNRLKNRFGVTKLELENQASDRQKDLQDLVNERERETQQNYMLAVGTTTFRNRKVYCYYEKSRPVKFVF